jgi:proline iminopeptidase
MRRLLALIALFAAPVLFAQSLFAQSYVKTADGIRLWTVQRGKGSPVIAIHGGPGMDHLSLRADLAPLERHHRVIYYDQRGGGRSTLPADTSLLSIEHHVADLEALRKHLGLRKVTLLAHSFGPAVATFYALQYPDRVERMIFLGPIPPRKGAFFEEYGTRLNARLTDEQRKRAEALSFDAKNVVEVCREYWQLMTPPRLAKSLPLSTVKADLCASPAEGIRYGMTKTNAATFGSLGDWNWSAALATLRVPVLILHGEEDAIPMTMVNEWTTALPNARIIRLKEAGHFPHAERPEIVFPAIETFLGGDWPENAVR